MYGHWERPLAFARSTGNRNSGSRNMDSIVVALFVLACTFGGAVLGMGLRAVLPEDHLGPASKEIINLGIALIGWMAAVVLGLLVASAKSAFDAQCDGFQQMAANVVMLDRALRLYGDDAGKARHELRRAVESVLSDAWTEHGNAPGIGGQTITANADSVYQAIQALTTRIAGLNLRPCRPASIWPKSAGD